MNEINIQAIPILLPCCTMCHFLADYPLQGVLANFKQHKWWEDNNLPNENHKNSNTALRIHGGSWAFMINFPIILYMFFTEQYSFMFVLWSICINGIIHYIVDDAKCNEGWISYRTDQWIHMIQVGITWLIYYLIMVF